MITEIFLDMCFSTVLGKSSIKQNSSLFKDILLILLNCKNNKKAEIPLNIKPKFDLLETICLLKLEGKSNENIIDSLSQSKKTQEYNQFMYDKSSELVSENQSYDNINQIRTRKKLISLYSNYDELITLLDSIRDGSFTSIDNVVMNYENMIRKIHVAIMETNKGLSIENSSSLDLVDDDYSQVLSQILLKYEKTNRTSTGFDILDQELFYGGYELSRLYMYAGASGSGKSTIMVNSLINSATKNSFEVDAKGKKVYVYISLENTVEETLLRIYQNLFKKTVPQALSDVKNNINIKEKINTELLKNNSTIVIKYFKPMITSPMDIISVLDDVVTKYGKESIKMLAIDYLDLLKSDMQYDAYRLELGYITLSLKSIAVEYNIPVVTATQLNRGAFRVKSAADLNLDQLSESTKKIDHSDCIILLVKDDVQSDIVYMKVGKNRSGKSNISINWKVDFSICKFVSGVIAKQSKQEISTNENIIAFKGLS